MRDENGSLVLSALMHTMDDTVALRKAIFSELEVTEKNTLKRGRRLQISWGKNENVLRKEGNFLGI